MIPYDTQFNPPAVVLAVTISGVVHRRPRLEFTALIDTGADMTAVPKASIERLKLYPIGRLQLEDANAVTTTVFTYEANVAMSGDPMKKLEVIGTPYPFVILGRDWLGEYYLLLDGPGRRFQISKNPLPIQSS